MPIFQDSPDAGLTPQTGVEFPHAENRETVKRVEDPIRSEEARGARGAVIAWAPSRLHFTNHIIIL